MDIPNDELRRRLREVEADQRAADKTFRSALTQAFDPDGGVSNDDRRRLLGMPHRRGFLRIGGLSIASAALIAACSSDKKNGVAVSGTDQSSSSTGAGNMDLALARTAASLEALAVATYDTAIKSGLVKTPLVGQVATLFMDHHQQHQDALNSTIKSAGGKEVTEPNAVVKAALVDPVVGDKALDEAKIIKLAYGLEDAAAQTYVFAAGALSTTALRSTIMTIGGIEAQHRAIIMMAATLPVTEIFPAGFYKSANPLPDGAVLTG